MLLPSEIHTLLMSQGTSAEDELRRKPTLNADVTIWWTEIIERVHREMIDSWQSTGLSQCEKVPNMKGQERGHAASLWDGHTRNSCRATYMRN